MALPDLSSGTSFLIERAKTYFSETFQVGNFSINQALDKGLSWKPSIHFRINEHLTIICEASEDPYPLILSMRRLDLMKLQIPVSVYCICPEEAYLSQQPEAKRLMNDGFGLLTVDAAGVVQRRATCIPLLQQITDQEFAAEIKPLPKKLKIRVAEAFERYKFSAPSGAADMAEVMEGLVLKAGREAAKKGWLNAGDAKPGKPAVTLKAMQGSPQFQNAAAAVGAAQAYISMYRNLNHHFPKDRKQAAKKYRDCRHGFLEGLKKVVFFRESMRNIGLSGGL